MYITIKKHVALIQSLLAKQRKENKAKESISSGLVY